MSSTMLRIRSLIDYGEPAKLAVMAIPRIGKLSKLHLYIQEHMDKRGLNDADVAEALDVARETVWRWRKGKQRPSNEDTARLAALLECATPEELYSPPSDRQSIDAQLKGAPDDIYKHVYDIAVTLSTASKKK